MVAYWPLFGDHSGMGIVLSGGGGGRDFQLMMLLYDRGSRPTPPGSGILRGRGTPNRHNMGGPGVVLAFSIRSSNWPKGWYKFLCLFDGHPLYKGSEYGIRAHIPRVTLTETD